MNITAIVQHSLLYGALLGVLTCALFLVGAYLSPEIMLQGYPPDVKAKYGPMSAKARRPGTAVQLLSQPSVSVGCEIQATTG